MAPRSVAAHAGVHAPTTCYHLCAPPARHHAHSIEAAQRVADGGTAFDPEVVAQLLVRSHRHKPLSALTPRERDVLALMAQGRSNAAVAAALVVSYGAVEKDISSIFSKLDLAPSDSEHRCVLAVLMFLQSP